MTYRTHILGGTASLWALAILPHGPDALGISCLVAGFGALLPDLDASSSKLQTLSISGIRPFMPVGWAVSQVFPHRSPLHSLAAVGVVTALLSTPLALWLGWQAGAALTLGYASHLLLDMCTVRGLMLLYPSRAPHWAVPPKLRIVTGGEWEHVYTATLGALTLILLMRRLFSSIGA